MSPSSENETEILLGNRHLLAIFFVLAVLLGIAFTGGYMVGRNSSDKRPASLAATAADPSASTSTGAETHALTPTSESTDQTSANSAPPPAEEKTHTVQPPPELTPAPPAHEEAPLGSPRNEPQHAEETSPSKPPAHTKADASSQPEGGQTYLQVAAVGHTEAKALADVLSKKGFHAHAVAKPGASDVYRVLVGPMRDTGELSTTRDSLRNAGFTKIFVQRF